MIDGAIRLDPAGYDAFVTGSDGLVVLYKDRCPYCAVVFKVLAKCLPGYPGLKIGTINSEEHPEMLGRLGTSKVPTVFVYAGGAEKGRRSGVMNPTELAALIDTMA